MATCKGCGAVVTWVEMDKSQKMNLIDPLPVADGNILVTENTSAKGVPIATTISNKVERERMQAEGAEFHYSHFVTCPKRDDFKKKPPAQGGTHAKA